MRVSLFKQRLLELEWPIQRLADKADLSIVTLNKLLNGEAVSERTVRKAAQALKIKLKEVLAEPSSYDTRTHDTSVVS